MRRGRFVARRLVLPLASLLAASLVIFAALYLAPGTPLAALSGGQPLPPGSAQVLEQRYHLNGAVNPALTAMANALRVGEHIADRIA